MQYKRIIAVTIITIILQLISTQEILAGIGIPGDPPGEPSGGTPIGGSAPVGGGSVILISLAFSYAGYKIYKHKWEKTGISVEE